MMKASNMGSGVRTPLSIKLSGINMGSRSSSGTFSPLKGAGSGSNSPAAAMQKEMRKKFKELNYFDLVAQMRGEIKVKSNSFRLKSYENTFVAQEAVKWLVKKGFCVSPAEAVYVGTELITQGHIYDVIDEEEQEFKNGYKLYKFCVDDRVDLAQSVTAASQEENHSTSSSLSPEGSDNGLSPDFIPFFTLEDLEEKERKGKNSRSISRQSSAKRDDHASVSNNGAASRPTSAKRNSDRLPLSLGPRSRTLHSGEPITEVPEEQRQMIGSQSFKSQSDHSERDEHAADVNEEDDDLFEHANEFEDMVKEEPKVDSSKFPRNTAVRGSTPSGYLRVPSLDKTSLNLAIENANGNNSNLSNHARPVMQSLRGPSPSLSPSVRKAETISRQRSKEYNSGGSNSRTRTEPPSPVTPQSMRANSQTAKSNAASVHIPSSLSSYSTTFSESALSSTSVVSNPSIVNGPHGMINSASNSSFAAEPEQKVKKVTLKPLNILKVAGLGSKNSSKPVSKSTSPRSLSRRNSISLSAADL